MKESKKWTRWRTNISLGTCSECFIRNGRIFSYEELFYMGAPRLHPNCKCYLEKLMVIDAGRATFLGTNGADWWLTYLKELPDYYITREEAEELGWVNWKGNLDNVAPGYMIFGGIYKNRHKILPSQEGRIWYEADINYTGGYRNTERVVFSNDGLVFVTYDHYETFIEVIGEEQIYE